MLQVSKRVQKIIASPIRKFYSLVLEAEKKGVKVFKLNVGDPDIEPPRQFWRTLKNYKSRNLPYAPSPGILEHTLGWVKYYSDFGAKLQANQIIPTVGCAEAILLAIMAVTDPGDELLVFEPLYSSYKGLAAMCNVKLVPVTLRVENNFSLPSFKQIEKKITKKTAAIVIINPNNPTGTILTLKEINLICAIAKKYNLFIISDETYREIVFEGEPFTFLKMKSFSEHVIVVDSVSKRFSCPGARIGCIASYNQEVMAGVLKIAQTRLSAPTLEQYALIPLLKNSKPYTEKIVQEYQKRRDVVFKELRKIPKVICQRPQGAFYIIAKLPVDDSDNFVTFLLKDFQHHKKTVLITPAKDFYVSNNLGKNEVRIAYVLKRAELKSAMQLLRLALQEYKN
jgi:aspartate aminotransferase